MGKGQGKGDRKGKDELVRAFRELLREGHSLGGLRGKAVAEKANVSSAAFSHYYSSRKGGMERLVADAAEAGFLDLNRTLREAVGLSRQVTGEELLVQVCTEYVKFAQDNAGLLDLMLRPDEVAPLEGPHHSPTWIQRAYAAGALQDLFRAAFPAERVFLRDTEMNDLRNVGWALMHGLATFASHNTLRDLGGGDDALRRHIEIAMGMLAREVRARAAAAKQAWES